MCPNHRTGDNNVSHAAPPPRIDVVIALAVGSTWGFLSVVFLTQPDPFQPIALIDYVAVVSFSVALAVLAPAAWLISKVAGRAMALHRRSAVAALALRRSLAR